MDREFLSITGERATEVFGKLYADYADDGTARKELAKLTGTTARIIGNQNRRRLEGNTISGEIYPRMCYLIAMSEVFGLEIKDLSVSQPFSTLLEDYRKKVEVEIENNLQEREQALAEVGHELGRREAVLAEESERSLSDMKEREEALAEVRRELDRRTCEVTEQERQARAHEAEVKASAADVEEHEAFKRILGIIREECREGGILYPKPGRSLALALAEFRERYQMELYGARHPMYLYLDYGERNKSHRIAIEIEERTFNFFAAPLRATIHKIVELA